MKIYVVLEWFYEGDSNLVNSFMGVKKTYQEAKLLVPDNCIMLSDSDFEIYQGVKQPKEWGGYGSESKFEIREVFI